MLETGLAKVVMCSRAIGEVLERLFEWMSTDVTKQTETTDNQ